MSDVTHFTLQENETTDQNQGKQVVKKESAIENMEPSAYANALSASFGEIKVDTQPTFDMKNPEERLGKPDFKINMNPDKQIERTVFPRLSDSMVPSCYSTGRTESSESSESSVINAVTSGNRTCSTGARLISISGIHYFKLMESHSVKLVHRLKIRTDDRILAINGACVDHWEHEMLHQCLQHVLSLTSESVVLVLERLEDSGPVIMQFTINVDLQSRGTSSRLSVAVSVIKNIVFPPAPITCVKFKEKASCWIKLLSQNKFLHINKNGVDLRPLTNFSETSYRFQRYSFSGIEMEKKSPAAVFICVFRHVETNDFLYCARGQPQIGLSSLKIPSNIDKIKVADPRFFLLHQFNDNDGYYFESMVYRDWFLCWSNIRQRLTIQEIQGGQILPGSFPNGEFAMTTSKQLHRGLSVQ